MLTVDELATFCKKKGFVYPSSELYGGIAGFFDYGPLGIELKNKIKSEWWRFFVQKRPNILGLDGAIVSHQKIWQASGHATAFNDLFAECTKCRTRIRADHAIEDQLKIKVEGLKPEDINKLIKENNIKCTKCKAQVGEARPFNLMFKTGVGPTESPESLAYLRPETAQLIFTDFKLVTETNRIKLPFGIAQIGKAFRNEISPRDFLFRSREFEQMEIEFFTHPSKADDCLHTVNVKSQEVNFISIKDQEKNKPHQKTTIKELLKAKYLTQWHAYWLAEQYTWFLKLGITSEHLRIRQHHQGELAHYATACFDIEYHFPFGWKEIHGNAARGNFDLSQHQKFSGKSLEIFDEETKEKVIPIVASEPSQGVDRAFLAFLFDAYTDDKERGNIVLKLHPKLVPIQVGIFPLLSNRDELVKKAQEIVKQLQEQYTIQYDSGGSIGRRYARADESGIPLCITIDFDTLKDDTVTIRNRDTTKQIRIKISKLREALAAFFSGTLFEELVN